jgi:hypothetical protein
MHCPISKDEEAGKMLTMTFDHGAIGVITVRTRIL